MTLILVSHLSEDLVNQLVAKLDGLASDLVRDPMGLLFTRVRHNYCSSWAMAGRIIEREHISLWRGQGPLRQWESSIFGQHIHHCCNPLRAAMLSFIESKIGTFVDVEWPDVHRCNIRT